MRSSSANCASIAAVLLLAACGDATLPSSSAAPARGPRLDRVTSVESAAVPSLGAGGVVATDVGEDGTVVGASGGAGYAWTPGSGPRALPEVEIARAIDSWGRMVGEAPGGATLVLIDDGVARDLGAPAGAVEVRASAMSDGGHVVGTYRTTAGGPPTGFAWTADGGFVSLGAGVEPRDVNTRGVVVGGMTVGTGPRRPFVWSADAGLRDPGVPKGDRGGEAWGINDLGDVVGESTARDGTTRATVWMEGGEARVLQIPHPSTARDIDERRNILAGSDAWGVLLWTMDAGVASIWPTGDGNVYTPVRLTEGGRVLGTYAGPGGPAATVWTLGMQAVSPAQEPATITGLAHQIRVLVVLGRLDPRRGDALVDRVTSLFERGEAQADNRIGAFIRTVQGYVRQGYLSPADGDALIAYAQRLLPAA